MHFPIFINSMYSMSPSQTPSAVMFSWKQKWNPRMSRGRRNVSSSLGQKKEKSEGTQCWKALGQRSSSCYGQSILKSLIWETQLSEFWSDFNIPLNVLWCAAPCFYVYVVYVNKQHCAHIFTVSLSIVFTCYTVYVCLILHVCIW